LKSEDAAPLFCGGVTVYAPLVKHAPPSKSVGIVGLGGLGHLAVKFAKARGNIVTVISGGETKKNLASELGADRYIDMSNLEALKAAENSLDFVLVTGTSPGFNHSLLLGLVKKLGTICYVAAQSENITINPMGHLLMKHINVTGNTAGGHGSMRDMLRFAALHKIAPMIELFHFADAQKALDGIKNNTTRFRAVLVM
jgi:alcohol/geraniol dehydrogenase (NADP+)